MRLYNTLTGEEKEFVPADGKTVKMYVCGVTPYSSTHVGHALSYVVFDTLRRYLEYRGYRVKHVQNFTDVDDKIIQRAQEAGISEDELTERFIADFFRTMDALNILRADLYPRATQEIQPILDTIQSLVDKDFAYPAAGDVYFRVNRKEGLRQAQPPHPGRHDCRRPGPGGRGQGTPHGLRSLEGRQARRTLLG